MARSIGNIGTVDVVPYRTLYDVEDGKFGVKDATLFGMEYHKGFKVGASLVMPAHSTRAIRHPILQTFPL
jgi:hypothetical protein